MTKFRVLRQCLFCSVVAVSILVSFPSVLPAADKGMTVAVLGMQSNNCPQELGNAVAELFISKLYATSLFTLMEKNQIEKIAERKGIKDFDITDVDQVAQLGKALDVKKVIVGSVNLVGTYRIETRFIDTSSGSVDVSASVTAETEKDIDRALSKAVSIIERHYLGYGNISGRFDLSASGGYLYPFGSIADDGAGPGYGVTVYTSFNRLFIEELSFVPAFSFYSLDPSKKTVKELSVAVAEGDVAYRVPLTPSLSFKPALGLGVLCSMMNHSPDGVMSNGSYTYKNERFYNVITSLRADLEVSLYYRWSFVISPVFIFMPDSAGSGYFAGLNLGISAHF